METKMTAVLIGATGLVGKQLLKQLTASENYSSVVVLTRRSTGFKNAKVTEHLVDFDHLADFKDLVRGDHAFCCLGTTMKTAGSKENFRRVDFGYVLEFARLASAAGISGYSLISSLGASKKSMVFYSRVKGEVEAAVSELRFERVNIFRPSLLLGDRGEKRAGEDIAKNTYRLMDALIPARYKGIQASVVANGMLNASLCPGKGIFIYPSEKIRQIGKV
jgi:uncharacterized protein YbjT (DUF2867 family)